MFPKGLSGFFAGFQIAVFAFVGIELVGTTAAETKDPEKALPRAINSIPLRIIMFYVLALIVIMAVTPWSQVVPDRSPFVELFVLVGLPAAASLINFVVLTSAASSANSGIFSTSRMLYGLAEEGVAPKAFGRLSARAVPTTGLFFSCLCLLGGVVLIYLIPNVMTVVHHGDHGLGDPVHVRLDHYPVQLPGLPQTASAAACGIKLQDATWQADVLGVHGVLRLRAGAADPAGRYPPGADGDATVVCGADHGLAATPA